VMGTLIFNALLSPSPSASSSVADCDRDSSSKKSVQRVLLINPLQHKPAVFTFVPPSFSSSKAIDVNESSFGLVPGMGVRVAENRVTVKPRSELVVGVMFHAAADHCVSTVDNPVLEGKLIFKSDELGDFAYAVKIVASSVGRGTKTT
jgi:hypothetical protein